jgi:hypothetical protein
MKGKPGGRGGGAYGVGCSVGEGGGDDGAGGVRRAPCFDDLGGACGLRVGLDD